MSENFWKAILGSSLLATIVSSIISVISSKKAENNVFTKALQFLLLGELKRQGKDHLANEEIDLEELQSYNEIFNCYKALGGNGYADALKAKVNALPIKIEE